MGISNLENFPTSASGKKMLSYVSDGFYDKSYVGKWLFQVMGIEYDKVSEIVEDLPKQFFPETATWGLMYHEIKWGLPVRSDLFFEERRRLIYQKRDCQTSMTPYNMERYLEKITGLEVHVADANDLGKFENEIEHPNMFCVTVIGNSSLDLKNLKAVIDTVKQSHTVYAVRLLDYRYEVLHNTYAAIVPQTKKTYTVEVA